MATDASTLLDAVNDAIAALLAGRPVQEYSQGGVSVRRMSLQDLRSLRRDLQREVNLAARGTQVLLGDVRRRPA